MSENNGELRASLDALEVPVRAVPIPGGELTVYIRSMRIRDFRRIAQHPDDVDPVEMICASLCNHNGALLYDIADESDRAAIGDLPADILPVLIDAISEMNGFQSAEIHEKN